MDDELSADAAGGSITKVDDSESELQKEALEKNEAIKLSDSIFVYPNRKMTPHGNVFEGEIRSGVYGVRPCAIKFAQRSEKNAKEARILSKLGSHTHVISIIQSGVHKDLFEEHVYIALDKCHKQNLRQYFEHRKESGLVYDVNIGLEYSKQIIAGMKYVHENLIFHRDLKPSNILLSLDENTIKLADFGLSQELKSTSSKVYCKHQFGTNGFRPPESFGNSWASLKSDIFSLGLVFYFIFSNGMSPLGDDLHLWTHNTQNGAFNISDLLVPNSKSTEHLIKLMLSQERCRRPSIWQVADHPCWTGNKVECNFDYGDANEIDNSRVKDSDSKKLECDDLKTEIESLREFLRNLEKMGYTREKISIIIFDEWLNHLQLFDPRNQTVKPMHEYNDDIKWTVFSSVSLGDHIYVLTEKSTHRIKYSDDRAAWERLPDLIHFHGEYPPAVAVSGQIIIAGASYETFTKSVTKYDPAENRWEKINDKGLAASYSANVASQGYVYCLGGYIGGDAQAITTNRVERLNIASQYWEEVAPMREARRFASAVECGAQLIVAGGRGIHYEELNSVEKYDPAVNQWTIIQPMTIGRVCPNFRCHYIDGYIYAVGDTKKGIERYNVKMRKWEKIELPDNIDLTVHESVSVQMKK